MLLILREEIICAIILAFLIFYYSMNKVKDKKMIFLKLVCFALIHVIFDMITVVTVNNREIIPDFVNRGMHILFYISGMLFVLGFYNYVIDIVGLYKYKQMLTYMGYVPLIIFIVMLVFLPMEYVEGKGTDYSYGPLAFVGYGLFVVYCISCILLLFIYKNRLEIKVKRALLPMIVVMFTAVVVQALLPELLMTGAAVTFVSLGMFVALDNPDKHFKEQALWDYLTQLKNQNCYKKELDECIYKYKNKKIPQFIGFVVADMNNLKEINDNYGHAEGDRMLAAAADVLRTNLKSAESVYRLGGDEFVAIYLSPDDAEIEEELKNVKETCSSATTYVVPLSIATGYSSGIIDDNTKAIFDVADRMMYENKMKMKQNIE